MVGRRNVRVLNIKCEKLGTEELVWDQQKGRIYTDKFVKITTPDQIITGEGMESDQTFSDWEIMNVSGTINRKKNDTLPCNEPVVPRRGRARRHWGFGRIYGGRRQAENRVVYQLGRLDYDRFVFGLYSHVRASAQKTQDGADGRG